MTIGKYFNRDFDVTPQTHKAIFGMTGTGKSVLLGRMFDETVRAGDGAFLIDFHGDLSDQALSRIPKNRTNAVIYLNPRLDRVPGINFFEGGLPAQIVSSLVSIVKGIWPENWGPRSEWLLENLCRGLLNQRHQVSIVSLFKLMVKNDFGKSTANYRKEIIEAIDDPVLREFFQSYEHINKKLRDDVMMPLLNKVGKLVGNEYVRVIIGQATSSFDFREAMDSRKVIICNLAKGLLGDDVSSLLGSIVVSKLALAALSREDSSDRPPFYVFADEFQNCIHGIDFPTILSEARKYGLFLTMATQTLTQVPEKTRASIFGNCATLVSFRVSGEDAIILAREFSTRLHGWQRIRPKREARLGRTG